MKFDFFETGTGPALLFLPGSFSTHAAWRAVQNELNGEYRMITTSLPGYGGTPEIRDDKTNNMELVTDFVAEVVARIEEPVHLIGHSYGGMNAYAATLCGKVNPKSIVTFEGNPIFSKHPAKPFAWTQSVRNTMRAFEEAVITGNANAAGIVIDFWSHSGMFQSMPAQVADYCRSKVQTNLWDWRHASSFTPEFSAYERLDMPCTVVRGELCNQAMRDVSDEIVANAQSAVLHIEPNAGHFLISTHPKACATVIDGHMRLYEANFSNV